MNNNYLKYKSFKQKRNKRYQSIQKKFRISINIQILKIISKFHLKYQKILKYQILLSFRKYMILFINSSLNLHLILILKLSLKSK